MAFKFTLYLLSAEKDTLFIENTFKINIELYCRERATHLHFKHNNLNLTT